MRLVEEIPAYGEIKEIVEKHGADRRNLLPILSDIRKEKKFVSPEAAQVVAHLLGIHPVEVNSVVSFYHFLNDKPKGEYVIRLCKNVSCMLNGKEEIKKEIEKKLGVRAGETTEDGLVTFEEINCFGLCDVGPAMMINDEVYTHVTPQKANDLISEILERGK